MNKENLINIDNSNSQSFELEEKNVNVQTELLLDLISNNKIALRQADTRLSYKRNHTVIKELALLLHYNIFRHHNKERTSIRYIEHKRTKILIQSVKLAKIEDIKKLSNGHNLTLNDNEVINAVPCRLPSPITKLYLYIALSAPRAHTSVFNDSQYVIEFDWKTFFEIYNKDLKNEYKYRKHISERLEELQNVHISHNAKKGSLKDNFWYCNRVYSDLSKTGGVQMYFDNFRSAFNEGIIFTIPLEPYLSLNSSFTRDLFVLGFCNTNQRDDENCFHSFDITLRDLFIKIGKDNWTDKHPSEIRWNFKTIIFKSISDLIDKDFFEITYNGKDGIDLNDICLDTVVTFKKGRAKFNLYNQRFMESPASGIKN